MNSPIVVYKRDGHVATITLNRPERRNALSAELFRQLAKTWRRFEADEKARVAILTGAGDEAFCAGGDLKEMTQVGGPSQFGAGTLPHPREIAPNTRKPVIAAVNGYAIAGGFWFAQMCDIRIASDRAIFAIAEVKWNLPAPWVADLTRIIGLGHALELVLTGEQFSAQRLHEMGFVNRVVPHEDLYIETQALARVIAENAPMAVQTHKEILSRSYLLNREDGFDMAQNLCQPLMSSEDAAEGLHAFIERRKPVWQGR